MPPAVVAAAYGGPEVLSVTEIPAEQPGPGQVVVEVRAAGVNPMDYKLYSGAFGTDPANLPMRLGFEGAGVVTAIGPDSGGDAGPVRVGDEVIAYPASGTYATEIVTAVASLTPKPAALDWPQAAGLMVAGVTAWHALEATRVGKGDAVLLHGGAGGVGHLAVQLAVERGATVVATASPARHDFLRQLGAIPVTYGPGLADRVRAVAPGGIDAAVDLVGTDEAVDVSFALVSDRSRVASIAAFGRADSGIKLLGGGPGADAGTEIRSAARAELARMAQEGRLRVVVGRTFPLDEAAAAHREIMAGHAAGKLALIP